MPDANCTEVFLVRHGVTDFNEKRLFQGIGDNPINANGQEQARLLADRFLKSGQKIDRIFVSRLQRTRQTAQPLADALGLELIVREGIQEIDGGLLEGRFFAENMEMYPEVMNTFITQPYLAQCPGGENGQQVYDRVVKAFNEIVAENQGKTIMMVVHGFVLQMLNSYLTGTEPEKTIRMICANTSVSHVFVCDGKIRVDYLFDASHLPEKWQVPNEVKNR